MTKKKEVERKKSKKELEYENNPALVNLPDYLTIEGVVFEKVRCYTEVVPLDLEPDVLAMVEKEWRRLGYTSPQAFIREALTHMMRCQ